MNKESNIFIDKILQDFYKFEILPYGMALSSEKALRFYNLYLELMEWNKKINLTSISGIDDFIKKHIIDSSYLLKVLESKTESLADVGSGAGFPGLVAAILNPSLQVFSIESVLKKCNFQKHVARKIKLDNFKCFNCNIFSCDGMDKKVGAFTTRAAFNPNELVNFIKKYRFESGNVNLYAFMSNYSDSVMVGNYKYPKKQVCLDKALFYRTSNECFINPNLADTEVLGDFRLIVKFGIEKT